MQQVIVKGKVMKKIQEMESATGKVLHHILQAKKVIKADKGDFSN